MLNEIKPDKPVIRHNSRVCNSIERRRHLTQEILWKTQDNYCLN